VGKLTRAAGNVELGVPQQLAVDVKGSEMAADEAELALQAAQQLHARLQLLVERTLAAGPDSFAAMDDRDGEQWSQGVLYYVVKCRTVLVDIFVSEGGHGWLAGERLGMRHVGAGCAVWLESTA